MTFILPHFAFFAPSGWNLGFDLPGDAFFRVTPAENYQAWLNAHQEERFKDYLGPTEIDKVKKTYLDGKLIYDSGKR